MFRLPLRTTFLGVAALLLTVALAGAVPAGAGAKRVAEQIRTLRDEVQEASEVEAALLAEMDAVAERRRGLEAGVAAVARELRSTEAELAAATGRLDRLSAELTAIQIQVTTARADLESAQSLLRRRAVAAYMNQGAGRLVAAMAGHSQREMAATYSYSQAMISAQETAVEKKNALSEQLAELEASVDARRSQALDQQQVVVAVRGGLEAKRQEFAGRRDAAQVEEARYGALVSRARERRAEFEAQIAQLQADSDSIGLQLRGVQGDRAGAGAGRGRLGLPVAARITSQFGPRVHPIFGDVRVHRGVDFGAAAGTPIRAAGAGTVVHAGPRGGYGNVVIVDHGEGIATLYAHQSAVLVSAGDRVVRGTVVGQVGSTGFSTGPHLHFEVRAGGTPVDPMSYL